MKVLVAIDGSESSLRALRYVLDQKGIFSTNPDVVLVTVHLPVPSPRAKAVLGNDAIEQYYKEECDEALAPARALLAGKPCRVTERPIVGQPAAQIVAVAQEEGCDLIAIGTHGHGALVNLLMGSVAMKVIAESPVPVLSVK